MQDLSDPEAAPPIMESGRPKVGVVLAAGRAERLSRVTRGRSKVLVRLGGVSAERRVCEPYGVRHTPPPPPPRP